MRIVWIFVKKVPAKIEGWADIQKLNDFNRKMKNLPKKLVF